MDLIRGIIYYLGYIYENPEPINEDIKKVPKLILDNKIKKNTLNDELKEYFKKKNIGIDI